MNQLYKAKHEFWLEVAFASFATPDAALSSRLYEFSLIAFRHMKWISLEIVESGGSFDYDRDLRLEEADSLHTLLESLVTSLESLKTLYPHTALGERLKADDAYFLEYLQATLKKSLNVAITAFNKERIWSESPLDDTQRDALTLFLLEESYKEYELILVYNFMQAHTQNAAHASIFQDLIDESHFHFKSFGEMMAKMGILTLPRELHPMSYIIKDLSAFVASGIKEEQAAKELCQELSSKITDASLSKFFNFINNQESYHIELMKKLL